MIKINKIAEDKRIFTFIREIPEYDNDPKELKVYIIPGQEIKKKQSIQKERMAMGIINNEEDSTKNRISTFLRYGYDLSEIDEEFLETDVKNALRMIYMDTLNIDDSEIKKLINLLKIKEARNLFLRILYENHSNNKVQEFATESFNAFLEVFTNALLIASNSEEEEKNEDNLIYFMKLLKISNKITTRRIRVIYLSDKIYSSLERYPLIYTKRFWEIWIEDGLSKEFLKIKNLEEKKDEYMIDNLEKYDDYKKEIIALIISLIPIMLKMRMDENSINSIISYMERKYINDLDSHKTIEENFLGLLQLYRQSRNN